MKIIDRYLTGEMLAPFAVGVIGFILILIVDLLFTFTDMIINKGVPFLVVLKLLVFKLPAILILTYPVSTLFGTSMALGRMSADSEIVALRTSGVSLWRIARPILVFALVVSALSFLTNEFIAPWSNRVSEGLIRQMILKNPVLEVKERVFFKDNNNRYYYVKRADPKSKLLSDVMIYDMNETPLPRVIIAKTAKFEGNRWDLSGGVIHKYDGAGRLEYEATFDSMTIAVPENFLGYSEQKTTNEMNARELRGLISMLSTGGVSTRALLVDFYMKFSVPLTCFVFALIGIPLSLPMVRSGRAFGVVIVICIIFTFYVFASVSRSFGYGGYLPPLAAAFVPQATFLLLGAALLRREATVR